jgi:hypothetical protein
VLFCVLCLIVVPLAPGTNPFAVKINNNDDDDDDNNNNNNNWHAQKAYEAILCITNYISGKCV